VPVVRLTALMRSYTNGQTLVAVSGGTVRAAVDDLLRQYPVLRPHLCNAKGELRPFVNLFVNQENIKTLDGMDTILADQDQVLLMPSISGGSQTGSINKE